MRSSTFRKTTTALYCGMSSSYSTGIWKFPPTIPMLERCDAIRSSSSQRRSVSPMFRWRQASSFHRSFCNTHMRNVVRLTSTAFSISSSVGSMMEESVLLLSRSDTSTSSPTGNDDNHHNDDDDNEASSRHFRVYYNDVYEVQLPPNHRFPMKKYRMVRELIQREVLQRQLQQQRRTVGDNAKKHTMPAIGTL
jgi:hypothetical protein